MDDHKRIIIVGSAGSGKSWLARKLGQISGYPVIHLDNEFWQPGWVATPKDEWIEKQKNIIAGDRWILDGNYGGTMEMRFTAADLIIFLDINRIVCIISAIRRRGRKRPDLPNYLDEKFDRDFWNFIKWIWEFPRKSAINILKLHEKYPDKKFLRIRSRRQMRKLILKG